MPEPSRPGYDRVAPWGGGAPWWVVLLQGLVALAVGVYVLTQPGQVGQWLVLLLAGYLLVTSVLDVYVAQSRALPAGAESYRTLAGGIGIIAGLLVFALPFFVAVGMETMIAILGIGLVATGLLGLVEALLVRGAAGFRWGAIISNLLRLTFGGLLLYLIGVGAAANVLRWLGIVAILAGVALVIYALVLYRRPAAAA